MKPLEDCRAKIFEHERVALQFSGGKDSMTTLFYLRPFWDNITVYWTNPGDALPETTELMAKVKDLVPHFVEITGNVLEWKGMNGLPSDVYVDTLTPFGELKTGTQAPFYITPTHLCCRANMHKPMMDRMVADGVTLIIRGEKSHDEHRNHLLHDGFIDANSVEYMFPIYDETNESVMEYLNANCPEFIHGVYATGAGGLLDCLTCTGWWDEYKGTYISDRYPDIAKQVAEVKKVIATETIALLNLVC